MLVLVEPERTVARNLEGLSTPWLDETGRVCECTSGWLTGMLVLIEPERTVARNLEGLSTPWLDEPGEGM
jgi:RNA polymerase subunit RPABC4/transcription elongation factor Spt4